MPRQEIGKKLDELVDFAEMTEFIDTPIRRYNSGMTTQPTTYPVPKLYEYFGLIVMFYANEHEPVHVHGKSQGREARPKLL